MKVNMQSLPILLNRLKVTADQLLFLVLVHDHLYAHLYAYTENNRGFSKEIIEDLIDKGYLETTNKNRSELYVDSYETTQKYKLAIYAADKSVASEEFWEAFPSFITIDTKKIPAKSLDKEKFLKTYYDKIGKYPDFHSSVMEALAFAVENSMICMGLEKWFLSEQWDELLKEKKGRTKRQFPNEQIF